MSNTYDSLGYYRKDRFENNPGSKNIDKIIPAYTGYSNKAWTSESPEDKIVEAGKITAILIHTDKQILNELEELLRSHYPVVEIISRICCLDTALRFMQDSAVELAFISVEPTKILRHPLLVEFNRSKTERILITDKSYLDFGTFECNFTGYLHLPFKKQQFIKLIEYVSQKINLSKDYKKCKELLIRSNNRLSQNDTLGIPTLEGYDFISIGEIICCSGLQKYTDVVTSRKKRIISSYNIGEFRKLLQPYGFFAPHKSFLINLSRIVHYHKEGTLTMSEGHHIPLARRRKESFLKTIKKNYKFPIIPQY